MHQTKKGNHMNQLLETIQSYTDSAIMIDGTIEFSLGRASQTGVITSDGKVAYNDNGLADLEFETLSDFIDMFFKGKAAPHSISHYVGERDDDLNITLFDEEQLPVSHREIEIIGTMNEDGSNVYSNPIYYLAEDQHYIVSIENTRSGQVSSIIIRSRRDFSNSQQLEANKLILAYKLSLENLSGGDESRKNPICMSECNIEIIACNRVYSLD